MHYIYSTLETGDNCPWNPAQWVRLLPEFSSGVWAQPSRV